MATHPQGHSLLPAEHVTTPQQNIQLATTLPLNIQPPNQNSNSHHDPHPTPSHLSLATPNSTFIKPIPTQPLASENVVSRELLPASDPVNPGTLSTTPNRPLVFTPNLPQSNQPSVHVSDSPPKRRKSDTILHDAPKTQAVVDALTIPPIQHTQQSESPAQNNVNKSAFVPQSISDDKLSFQSQTSPQERQENDHIAQPAAHPQHIASASLASPTVNDAKEAVSANETDPVSGSVREPVREAPPPPNADNTVIRYVPDSSSSLITNKSTSPPNSDSSHRLLVFNSSLDMSSPSVNVPGVSLKRRKRDSSAASETQANGELPSRDAELQEPELKRLKSDENATATIPSGTQVLKDDEKPLAVDADLTDSSQAGTTEKADDDATKSENQSDTSDAGQRDPDVMQVDGKVSKPSKPAKNDRVVSASTLPRSGISLPLLRSSPITIERDGTDTRATLSKADDVSGDDSQKTINHGDGQESSPTVVRKKKSVSWASEEKLVEVQYIDTRMELVRSWDADSQVTLPFAPATLQMFQQALKDQDVVKRKEGQSDGKAAESLLLRSMPKLTSFEEARKREHDMEQGRARQAREELKEKLNAMTPTTSWRTPGAIVLPAECRIEEPVQRFDLAGSDAYLETLPADPNAGSPPSPPYRPRDSHSGFGADSANIPVIPLSDRLNQNGDTGFDASAVNDNSDSRDYMRPEPRQDTMGETPNRGRPNSDRSMNYKAGSDSSQEYRYSGTHDGGDVNMAHNTRPDSRMTQNSHGQYDMAPNNYSDMSAAPGSSQVQAVQHLLSALQSSGLLKPGSGSGGIANNNADYNRQSAPMHAQGSSDGGYREGQQGDQREVRNQDRDTYDKEGQKDDRGRADNGMQSQGMGTPDGAIPAPLLGPGMGGPFPPGMQQAGMMDMMPFAGAMGAPPMGLPPMGMGRGGVPPGGIPPPPIGIPPLGMLQMMGLPMPMMPIPPGLQMTDGGQGQSTSGGGNGSHSSASTGRSGSGRVVETISRPKPKPQKQRKRCKYFGTKQGCRDGNACMFAHN